jgi:hypothetical protein
MSADDFNHDNQDDAPSSPDDSAALARMTPEELGAYRKEASACKAIGVRLTPAAWSDSETFGKALALLRCLPTTPYWTPAQENLVRAIGDVWPALARPADELAEEGEYCRDTARNSMGFALAGTWLESRPDALKGRIARTGEGACPYYFAETVGPETIRGFWVDLSKCVAPVEKIDEILACAAPGMRWPILNMLGAERL